MSLEMAQKVIVPQKKNYVPQFLKQRDINSYFVTFFKTREENGFVSNPPVEGTVNSMEQNFVEMMSKNSFFDLSYNHKKPMFQLAVMTTKK
jgi:hypothetical protein